MTRPHKYFAHGGLETENMGNGTKRTMIFNNRLQPTEIKLANTSSGSEIQRYNYSYGVVNASTGTVDATKNTGQVGRADGYNNGGKKWEQRYSYDSLGRLDLHAEHRGDNGTLVYRSDYDHDRYGNRMQSSGGQNYYPAGMTPPVVVASSEIQAASNRITTNMTYDDAGNITTDGKFRGMYYQYDANSRMRWASPTASSVDQSRSVYDALGWRVQAVRWAGSTSEQTRHMIYDAFGRQVAEYQVGAGAGWMCDNVHRGAQVMAMEEPGEVCYLLGDRQGSKRVMLDNSGGVEARHDYMAYGQEVASTIGMRDSATQKYGVPDNARQRFAQTEDDKATGLEHAKWRKMESDAGRWTSPDPYRTSMRKGNPQSMNRYAYTQNDPVNAVDPSGLEMIDPGYYGVEEVIQVNVYASRFTPFYHYDAIGMNIGDNFGAIFDGRPVPEFAEPQQPGRVPLSGDNLVQYTNERNRLLDNLNNSESCKSFLLDKLQLSASRIADAVRGQRAFDGTASMISTEAAGIQPRIGLFAGISVQEFFAAQTPDAVSAVYSSGAGGSTPRDVYYGPSGLNAATILHETLHTFYGSTYPDDRSLATQLGVSEADYNNQGPQSTNTALRNAGCG